VEVGIKPDQEDVIALLLSLVVQIALGSFSNANDVTWNHVLLIALFEEIIHFDSRGPTYEL